MYKKLHTSMYDVRVYVYLYLCIYIIHSCCPDAQLSIARRRAWHPQGTDTPAPCARRLFSSVQCWLRVGLRVLQLRLPPLRSPRKTVVQVGCVGPSNTSIGIRHATLTSEIHPGVTRRHVLLANSSGRRYHMKQFPSPRPLREESPRICWATSLINTAATHRIFSTKVYVSSVLHLPLPPRCTRLYPLAAPYVHP